MSLIPFGDCERLSATSIEMNERSVYSRRDPWISAWIGDELIMMSAESSVYLSLSRRRADLVAFGSAPDSK